MGILAQIIRAVNHRERGRERGGSQRECERKKNNRCCEAAEKGWEVNSGWTVGWNRTELCRHLTERQFHMLLLYFPEPNRKKNLCAGFQTIGSVSPREQGQIYKIIIIANYHYGPINIRHYGDLCQVKAITRAVIINLVMNMWNYSASNSKSFNAMTE